ncbi:MAG: hypothetical protein LBB74_03610 [Chitinispirillales bacterium]|jgi:uncharacterized protein (TIGR02145 family)|nr:hypothetical protein [Chitinispirillales bacterium]
MRAMSAVRAMAFLAAFAGAFAIMWGCGGSKALKNTPAKIKNVAVVETEVDMPPDASVVLNPTEVRLVTAELRREAVKNLPRDRYNIMTSETVIAQGSAVLEECFEENCVIALGSKIGADYIVRGVIRKSQTKFALSVDIYDTEDGNLVASSEAVRSENIEELIEKAASACADIYRMFVNPQSYTAQSPPVTQPATPHQPAVAAPPPSAQTPAPVEQTPAPAAAPSNQQSGRGGSGAFTDKRDGKTYRAVVIGGKTWMAENLNYETGKSWCYDNKESNCNKYGRLYDWKTAMKTCPSGWHLPSNQEWDGLVGAAGGKTTAGKKLKSTSGWSGNGNGTDEYGFSALPGGDRYTGGSFINAGGRGYWWTATKGGASYAYYRDMYYDYDYVIEFTYYKEYGFAVRCVGD